MCVIGFSRSNPDLSTLLCQQAHHAIPEMKLGKVR